MSKSVLIIDTPTNCYECPCFMDVGWRCQCKMDINEDVHDGRPDWCPLKEEKDAITIDWIEKKAQEFLMNRNFRWATDFQEVVDMWKVENNIPLFDGELKITLEKENE